MFDSSTPIDTVVLHLTRNYGDLEDFLNNVGEDLPTESMVEAGDIVNQAIDSEADVDGAGRVQDMLMYAAHTEPAPVSWHEYIEEAREQE